MNRSHALGVLVLLALAGAGCASDSAQDSAAGLTEYVTGQPVADQPVVNMQGTAGAPMTDGTGGMAPPPQTMVQGAGGSAPPVAGTGGMTAPVTTPGTGGVGAAGMGVITGGGTGGGMGTGTGGMGVVAGGTGGMTASGGPKPTMLTFEVTTATQGGKYAPKNVGAIWIEDSSGKWVHTLDYWNGWQNTDKVSRYNQGGGPKYVQQFLFQPADAVWPAPADVVTSATLTMHKKHTVMWNLKDKSGAEVADGMYKLVVECTEANAGAKFHEITFTKGAEPVMMMDDTPEYTGMKLTLQ